MTLENFEKQIDPRIVERGYEYFLEGAVENMAEKPKGLWSATVVGSDEYEVSVSVNSKTINQWECECPYEHGPVCKHVVAVLYSIRDQDVPFIEAELVEADSSPHPPKTKKSASPGKSPKEKDSVETLLQKLSADELKAFVIEQISQNSDFKNAFITSFAEKQEGDSRQKYGKLIHNIAKSASDKHSFIDYRSAEKMTNQILELCNKASLLLAKNNLTESLAITQAVLEEIPEIAMNMDDSDGGASFIWEAAFKNFHDIIEKAPPLLKDQLFDYCVAQYPLDKYHDCSFDDSFLDVLPQLINSGEQEKAFFELLGQRIMMEQKRNHGEYAIVALLKAKISYLEQNGRSDEALAIINNNIHLSDFRNMLIEKAMNLKNYQDARQLCISGIDIAAKNSHPGTVAQYTILLLEIAELLQDIPEIRRLAEKLFFNNHYDFKFYRILKKSWEKEKWLEKCEEIIIKIKAPTARGNYYDADTLAQLFVEEGYVERLLLLMQLNSGHLKFIDEYSKHLSGKFPVEVIELYKKAILAYVEDTGRSVYNDIARYMKKLAKIPDGLIVVNYLLSQFREKYRNRRAMMEILDKHFK